MRKNYLKHITLFSKTKKIQWNYPFFLHEFDIHYELSKEMKVIEQGITNNFFYFRVKPHELVIYYKHRKAAVFAWEDKDINWLEPVDFKGRFQFSSFSNHFLWKWKDYKLKIKSYFLMDQGALVLRMGMIKKKYSPFYINSPHENRLFVPHKRLNSYLLKDQEVIIHSNGDKAQWLLILPLYEDFDKPRFNEEKRMWARHCSNTKQVFKKYFLAVNDFCFMRQFLLFLYRQYQKSKELVKPFPPFPFLEDKKDGLRLGTLSKMSYRRCYFHYHFPMKYEISGYYEKNQIKTLWIYGKGSEKINLFFRFRKKKYFILYNNSILKTIDKGQTMDLISLELEKNIQYTIFF